MIIFYLFLLGLEINFDHLHYHFLRINHYIIHIWFNRLKHLAKRYFISLGKSSFTQQHHYYRTYRLRIFQEDKHLSLSQWAPTNFNELLALLSIDRKLLTSLVSSKLYKHLIQQAFRYSPQLDLMNILLAYLFHQLSSDDFKSPKSNNNTGLFNY